jgi:hypothetical protein
VGNEIIYSVYREHIEDSQTDQRHEVVKYSARNRCERVIV